MISCYNCKYGDLDTLTEPCKSCLEKGTPPHWRFVPEGDTDVTVKTQIEQEDTSMQLTIFDVIEEDNNEPQ